jgi:hypothetical protein
MMASIFWDSLGIIMIDYLEQKEHQKDGSSQHIYGQMIKIRSAM